MKYVNEPENMTDTQRWAFYKMLSKMIAVELRKIEENVMSEIGEFGETEYGNVQKITKVTFKPKEELKMYLNDREVLDICMKDEIDMSKVKELVESGVLDEDEVSNLLTSKTTDYLKFKS